MLMRRMVSRPRGDRDTGVSRPRHSEKLLETETFETVTTTLAFSVAGLICTNWRSRCLNYWLWTKTFSNLGCIVLCIISVYVMEQCSNFIAVLLDW